MHCVRLAETVTVPPSLNADSPIVDFPGDFKLCKTSIPLAQLPFFIIYTVSSIGFYQLHAQRTSYRDRRQLPRALHMQLEMYAISRVHCHMGVSSSYRIHDLLKDRGTSFLLDLQFETK